MFYLLRNLFALLGLVVVALAIFAAVKFGPVVQTFSSFDEKIDRHLCRNDEQAS